MMAPEDFSAYETVCKMFIDEAGLTIDEFFQKSEFAHYRGKTRWQRFINDLASIGNAKAFYSAMSIPGLRFYMEVRNQRREDMRLSDLGTPTIDAWNKLVTTLRTEFPAHYRW